jgi:hypothetical protein
LIETREVHVLQRSILQHGASQFNPRVGFQASAILACTEAQLSADTTLLQQPTKGERLLQAVCLNKEVSRGGFLDARHATRDSYDN